MAFDDDVVRAICDYMNDDPAESNLTIVQGISGNRTITRADLIFFDFDGAVFATHSPDGTAELRIPWQRTISERPEVREQLFALLNQATDAFGTR